jgi:hypothetical protein
VEYYSFPATGTTQIATVVYGQSQVLYAIRLAMQYRTLEIGTLVFVAVTVRAIRDRSLQVLVHVVAYDI